MTRGRKLFIGVLIIIAVVIVIAVIQRTGNFGNFFISGGADASSGYQAVFLTNNQVYFGKLTSRNSQFPELRDIYYLQVANQGGGPIGPEDISLVKLGNELHGPLDEMKINRDHILLIEDLREDSNVVDAIERFKEGDDR